MLFSSFLEKVVNSSEFETLTPAYRHRLLYAYSLLTGGVLPAREIDVPYYLNDLGVRQFKEIAIYCRENLKRVSVELPSTSEIISFLLNTPLDQLSKSFDAVILSTGNYEAISEVVAKKKKEILESNIYQLLIYSATAFVAVNPEDSLEFFRKAALCSPSAVSAAVAYHRMAVTTLKRLHNFSDTKNIILEMLKFNVLNTTEKLMIFALINNLYALLALMENDKNSDFISYLAIYNSSIMIDSLIGRSLSEQERSQAIRYKSQIAINEAQIYIKQGNRQSAIKVLKENLDYIQEKAPEYVCEASGCLAYALFLEGNFNDSIEYAKKSIREYSLIGDLKGLKNTREILAGAYEKAGQHEKALETVRLLEDDLLGEKEYLT